MKDEEKSGEQLLAELRGVRARIDVLEARFSDGTKSGDNALHECEKRFEDIVFSMADWVWEVDSKGVYTYCSHKVIDLLGRSPEEVIGKTPFDFMPPDEAERVRDAFEALAARKKPLKDIENWNVAKNGAKVCLLTNGVPLLDPEGNLIAYRGVDKDITGRKRAEEAVIRSEEKYHALFDNAGDAIFIVGDGARILAVNPMACERLGYTEAELTSLRLMDIDPTEKDTLLSERFTEFKKTGHLFFETAHLRKDGSFIPTEITARAVMWDGIPSVMSICRDITERKRAEQALREAADQIKTLRGIIPICANCKKIRDDKGYWNQVEAYIRLHTEAEFSHSICPSCMELLYPGLDLRDESA